MIVHLNKSYNERAEVIRRAINARPLTDFYQLTASRYGGYVCPLCGSGMGSNHTGALYIKDLRVTCFSCGGFGGHAHGKEKKISSDTLGALRILYPNKREWEIFAMCGYDVDSGEITQPQRASTHAADIKPKQEQPVNKILFTGEIQRWSNALAGSRGEEYLLKRGISIPTQKRFCMGYDAKHDAVIIPFGRNGAYYMSRTIKPDAAIKHFKPSGVQQPLFNAAALRSDGAVFLTEAPLCAISIAQAGANASALGGLNYSLLLKENDTRPVKSAILACLDNDEKGKSATAEMLPALQGAGIVAVNVSNIIMSDGCKDPNEALQKIGAGNFAKRVEDALAIAR